MKEAIDAGEGKLGSCFEPASARWPIFGVRRSRKSCCTKDHEFLARRSPRKVVVPRIMNSWPDKLQREVVVPRIRNSWPDKDQSKVVVPRARVRGRESLFRVIFPGKMSHFPGENESFFRRKMSYFPVENESFFRVIFPGKMNYFSGGK